MYLCLIVQPIHPDAIAYLKRHNVTPVTVPSQSSLTQSADAANLDAIITRNLGIGREVVVDANRLRVIAVHGIGTDAVPLDLATERGILVTNTPDANTQSVAEHALALLLAVAKHVPAADRATRECDFTHKFHTPSREIAGGTLGLVGFGRIAKRVAAMAQAFSIDVLALSPRQPDEAFALCGVQRAPDLDTLLSRSDYVSLHVPLSDATRGLVGERELALMRRDAILINTSRGSIVDEIALARWLAANPSAGAGIDVFSVEPPPLDHPLLALSNVVLSPHIAASSEAALRRMGLEAAESVIAVLEGRTPRNIVNPDALRRSDRAQPT